MLEEVVTYVDVFKKKFTGVCKRSPVFMDFHVTPEYVTVHNIREDLLMSFEINYNKKVKDFITEVRSQLREAWFPRMIERDIKIINPSTDSIQKDIEQGFSFDEAFEKNSKEVETTEYYIDKIDIRKNRMVLVKVEEPDSWFLYEMSAPVIFFLKRTKSYDPFKRWDFFETVATYKGGGK